MLLRDLYLKPILYFEVGDVVRKRKGQRTFVVGETSEDHRWFKTKKSDSWRFHADYETIRDVRDTMKILDEMVKISQENKEYDLPVQMQ